MTVNQCARLLFGHTSLRYLIISVGKIPVVLRPVDLIAGYKYGLNRGPGKSGNLGILSTLAEF